MDQWQAWIGRTEQRSDVVTAAPIAALAATLDRADPAPQDGDPLAPLWHWLYFLPQYLESAAGPDGHAKRGTFLPPIPLPRRMWAGGRVTFIAPLHVGERIARESRIVDIARKEGRSGPLAFVVVRHTISGAGRIAIIEEHDIVFRGEARAGVASSAPTPAPVEAAWSREIDPDPVLLFRFGLGAASVIMEEINRCGGNSAAVHGQMYNMGTLLRHGSEAQKRHYLPRVAEGKLRIQSMAVTEPTTGTDTTKIRTTAVRAGDRYVVNGQKVWISRVQHSDLMILLARTTPLADVGKRSQGMSIFIVDLRDAVGHGLTVRPIANLVNHETNELFFDNLEIPAANLIGEEGQGFRYLLDGLNAERTLIAAECIGDGYWFIDRAARYANDRVVFDRPIGRNQGVQFPIAESYIEIEAANLMRFKACALFDGGAPCGAEANMAKYLAAKASWEAADVCLQTHGGYGFATEYDIERKFRETRLHQVAPISTNMIFAYIAEHVLGLPRSF